VPSTDKVNLSKDGGGSPKEQATEVWSLVRDYAKQETVDPLKRLLGFVKWGLVGAIVLGIGLVELTVALLRALQAEGADVFDGNWSVVPYLATLVVALVVLYLIVRAMTSKTSPTEPA
jgi:hypothetical protein